MYFSEAENPESHTYSAPSYEPPTAPAPLSLDGAQAEAGLPLAARIINSKSLFGESRIIHIEHRGMIYRMSITSQNRLILQK